MSSPRRFNADLRAVAAAVRTDQEGNLPERWQEQLSGQAAIIYGSPADMCACDSGARR